MNPIVFPSVSVPASVSSPDSAPASDPGTALPRGNLALPGVLQNPADRRAVRLAWKSYVHRLAAAARLPSASRDTPRGPSARDLAVYCLLLGRPLHRSFTPVTNSVKLANGQRPYDTLTQVLANIDRTQRGMDLYALLGALAVPFEDIPGKRLSGGGYELPRRVCPAYSRVKEAAAAVRVADVSAAWVSSNPQA